MTKDMFYKLLIAAVVAGVAITVLSSIVGCQAPYRGVGDYQADDKKTLLVFRPKIDPKDEKIKDLEFKLEAGYASQQALADQIRAEKQINEDNWRRVADLEKGCGFGDVAHGNNSPVFTANRPEDVDDYNYERYSNGEERRRTPLNVKHIKLAFGKDYPDIVCFDFPDNSGGQTCFDPMEITER